MLKDTYKHRGQRLKLVEELIQQGITDEKVLKAISRIPRHLFLDPGYDKLAYENKAFEIGAGQTISQPYTVAFQTQLLGIEKGEKVLEIGTGSGYQTAVLLELGAQVYTIERQKELYYKSQALLSQLGYHPQFFYGDGYKGKPGYSPFDKIIVTAGAPFIPEALQKQLTIGGILVIPVGNQLKQTMFSIVRVGENEFQKTNFGDFLFVPMLSGKQSV
ncbi:MAG: protein-L-isoaspartate(D-aspartate) O-methyltransferase [Bacteroidales bacterium]